MRLRKFFGIVELLLGSFILISITLTNIYFIFMSRDHGFRNQINLIFSNIIQNFNTDFYILTLLTLILILVYIGLNLIIFILSIILIINSILDITED